MVIFDVGQFNETSIKQILNEWKSLEYGINMTFMGKYAKWPTPSPARPKWGRGGVWPLVERSAKSTLFFRKAIYEPWEYSESVADEAVDDEEEDVGHHGGDGQVCGELKLQLVQLWKI